MRIILHIGTDKTGSTAIQQHLVLNLDWLTANSVLVPMSEFDRGNGHAELLGNFAEDQVARLHVELAEAEKKGFSTALLTWEGMNFFPLEKIQLLRKVLSGYELSVLVYLREQADIIQTGLLQQFKSLSPKISLAAIDHPVSSAGKVRRLHFLRPPTRDYYRLIRRWQKGLPGADFLIRIYEREKLLNGNVVDDFVAQLGLDIDQKFVYLKEYSNISLDVESAFLIDRWRREQLPEEDQRRLVDVALSVIANEGAGSKYFLREKDVSGIRRYFRGSNKKLARHFPDVKSLPFSMKRVSRLEPSIDEYRERADQVERRIAEIDDTPTLWPLNRGADIHPRLDISEGWQRREDWGVWSKGPLSKIRFRVWRRFIKPTCIGIRVVIRGRYFGDNVSTSVEINGKTYPNQVLNGKHPGLELPIDCLLPYEMIDITLRHHAPISPAQLDGRKDSRIIAFGLIKFGYVFA